MNKKVTLILAQSTDGRGFYKVTGMSNTTNWDIGQELSKEAVDEVILDMDLVEVVIEAEPVTGPRRL